VNGLSTAKILKRYFKNPSSLLSSVQSQVLANHLKNSYLL